MITGYTLLIMSDIAVVMRGIVGMITYVIAVTIVILSSCIAVATTTITITITIIITTIIIIIIIIITTIIITITNKHLSRHTPQQPLRHHIKPLRQRKQHIHRLTRRRKPPPGRTLPHRLLQKPLRQLQQLPSHLR